MQESTSSSGLNVWGKNVPSCIKDKHQLLWLSVLAVMLDRFNYIRSVSGRKSLVITLVAVCWAGSLGCQSASKSDKFELRPRNTPQRK